MRPTQLLRPALFALALAASGSLSACCRRPGSDATAETIATVDGVTEQHPAGTVSWAIAPDGSVKALVKAPGNAAVDKSASGTVTARALPSGAPTSAKLAYDEKAGLFTAALPRLDADLTEVKYDLVIGGKPGSGVLHLPKGGTAELIRASKAASAKPVKGSKGPNGGEVQVVGDDVLEIVADQKTGEVRVYVLNDELKPVAVGKRKVRLALVAGSAETVELTVEPGGTYLVGKLVGKANPHKITVALYPENETVPVVVLCGWAPGSVIVIGPGAPSHAVFVTAVWAPVVVAPPTVVVHKGKGKGKWKRH